MSIRKSSNRFHFSPLIAYFPAQFLLLEQYIYTFRGTHLLYISGNPEIDFSSIQCMQIAWLVLIDKQISVLCLAFTTSTTLIRLYFAKVAIIMVVSIYFQPKTSSNRLVAPVSSENCIENIQILVQTLHGHIFLFDIEPSYPSAPKSIGSKAALLATNIPREAY